MTRLNSIGIGNPRVNPRINLDAMKAQGRSFSKVCSALARGRLWSRRNKPPGLDKNGTA